MHEATKIPRVSSQPTNLETISGTLERVTYHSPSTGFGVLRLKVRGHRDLVTVTGNLASAIPGETLQCEGKWVQNKEYGQQFQATTLRSIPPSSIEGIEKYLASGMVKGIGPHFAQKLVRAFGEKVFDIIEAEPKRLFEVEGIGAVRHARITQAWKDQKAIREIMVFLQSHGISTTRSVRIYKTYGETSIDTVRRNPYQLARDVFGIGFKTADVLAQNLGIPKDSLLRAEAGLSYLLLQKVDEGHCAYPKTALLEVTSKDLDIPHETLNQALELALRSGDLIRDWISIDPPKPPGAASAARQAPDAFATAPVSMDRQELIFQQSLFNAEKRVALNCRQLVTSAAPSWGKLDPTLAIAWAEKKLSLILAPAQKEAIQTALRSRFSIITGGPGTGKSTLTKSLVEILLAKKQRLGLCSPTGKAAKRLAECTSQEAKTLHRTLGFDPKKGGFVHGPENPLPLDLLIVDEASILDLKLMDALLQALPTHASLLLIGDVDQLPSVGPGQVLRDLIESGIVPTVRLTQIFRQAATSKIIEVAHALNSGRLPDLRSQVVSGQSTTLSDFYFIEVEDPDRAVVRILELVRSRIPLRFGFDPCRDIQVLCPMQRGSVGARNLNSELQKNLMPLIPTGSTGGLNQGGRVERYGYTFQVGDKVMVIRNDYDKEIFNGDSGFVCELDLLEQELSIDLDGRVVTFEFDELDLIQPAYAITVHKSQGSEYPVVVIPFLTQHFPMLRKNLLYTAITRGKRLVVLVGQKRALGIALKNSRIEHRLGGLLLRLRHQEIPPIE